MTDVDVATDPPLPGFIPEPEGPWTPLPPVGPDNVVTGEPSVYKTAAPLGTPPPGFYQWASAWVDSIAPGIEAKAAEYGSNSLAKKGYRFATAQNRGVTQSDALQLGTLQYAAEKLDRIEDALLRGQSPSDDTVADAAVYLMMTMYIRTFGRWV